MTLTDLRRNQTKRTPMIDHLERQKIWKYFTDTGGR
jgi:hypothetical protein